MSIPYFRFEDDFVEDGFRCIPMVVRFKLDTAGIKLKLSEWSKMDVAERTHMAEAPCESPEDIAAYHRYVRHLVRMHTGTDATPLHADNNPEWAELHKIPQQLRDRTKDLNIVVSLEKWQTLNPLQRFALVKLSGGGHEHKNLLKALQEFYLAADQVTA